MSVFCMFSNTSYKDYINSSLYEEIKDFPDQWFGTKYEDTPDDSIVIFDAIIPKNYVKSSRTFIVKTNDVHYFNNDMRDAIIYTYTVADYILGPYTDTVKTLYNIPEEKLILVPHSAPLKFQISAIKEDPIPKIFFFGASNSTHYPLREGFIKRMKDSENFVRLEHPGYESKKSESSELLKNYICSYTSGAFPKFEIPEGNHSHYLVTKFFEIMCSGVLLLTDDSSVITQLANLGLHAGVHYIYSETEKLDDAIAYILNPENRLTVNSIRKSGWELCMKEHTSKVRCAQIIERIIKISKKKIVIRKDEINSF